MRLAAVTKGVRPYMGKSESLARWQSTNDIINGLVKYSKVDAKDYDNISLQFWKGDVASTARGLFDFCKAHIRYNIEPDDKQTVRSPGAILAMKEGDCKHYASFIYGVLSSLQRKGYPVTAKYRFANYKLTQREPHHVFVVAFDKSGTEYWIDPVLPTFNQRKAYVNKTDKIAGMALTRVSGFDDLPNIAGKKRRARIKAAGGKKQFRAQKKAKRKERRANRPGLFKRVLGAGPRNAYLLLLKMNVKQMATNAYKKIKDNPGNKAKLDAKWKKLGGNPKALHKSIAQGVKRYNKHHSNKQIKGIGYVLGPYGWDSSVESVWVDPDPYVGVVGVVPLAGAAAALAAAAPVLAAIGPLLKSLSNKTETEEGDVNVDSNMDPAADSGFTPGTGTGDEDQGDYGQYDDYGGEDQGGTPPSAQDDDDTGFEDEGMNDEDTGIDFQDEGEYEEYTGMPSDMGFLGLGKKAKAKRQAKKSAKQQMQQPVPGRTPGANIPAGVRKVKIVQRGPGILDTLMNKKRQGGPAPGRNRIPTQVKKTTPGPSMPPATDRGGAGNFFMEMKDWVTTHKVETAIAAAGLAIPLLFKAFSGPRRRRR